MKEKRSTDAACTELLIVYLIKRMKINYQNKKYTGKRWKRPGEFIRFCFAFVDVVQDCMLFEDIGGNFYRNKEIFIMHE